VVATAAEDRLNIGAHVVHVPQLPKDYVVASELERDGGYFVEA
jgi:hypothetical protein